MEKQNNSFTLNKITYPIEWVICELKKLNLIRKNITPKFGEIEHPTNDYLEKID